MATAARAPYVATARLPEAGGGQVGEAEVHVLAPSAIAVRAEQRPCFDLRRDAEAIPTVKMPASYAEHFARSSSGQKSAIRLDGDPRTVAVPGALTGTVDDPSWTG